jgi:DNA-binding CsgD family transcriptional regulator
MVLVEGITDGGGCLVIGGGPGIGKSALLAQAGRRATERGMRVLRASGVQPEARLPFAGLHQLLQPLLGEVRRLLPAQREALLGAFGMALVEEPALFRVALAALQLLTECAADGPILLLVEDAQWLDPATGDALAFIGRRVESDPVGLLVAHRDDTPSALDGTHLPLLRLAPLDGVAAVTLLDAHAPALPPGIRRRILDEAAGNPLALLELPVESGHLATATLLPQALPLTTRLERAFAGRAAGLPAATGTLLLVAALNDSQALAETLAAAGSVLGTTVGLDTLEPAVAARLVAVDDGVLRFRHPLVRSALRHAASVPQRHAALMALARVLAGQPDRQVWHLAAASIGPDPVLAAELEAAATRAERRAALATAAAALERAAQLTKDQTRKGERLLRAVHLARELGKPDVVARLLDETGRLELHGPIRARFAFIKGVQSSAAWSGTSQIMQLVGLADGLARDTSTGEALDALLLVALRCWWSDLDPAARDLIVRTAERLGVPDEDVGLIAVLAHAAPVQRGATVIDRLSRIGPRVQASAEQLALLARAATAVGAFDRAAMLLPPAVTRLRTAGKLATLTHALVCQALTHLHLGNLGGAAAAVDEAVEMGRETAQPQWVATARSLGAITAALRGDLEAAESLAERAENVFARLRSGTLMALVQWARGVTALSAGQPAQAYEQLRPVFDPAAWTYHPFLRYWAVPDLADAAIRVGQVAETATRVAELEPLAEQSRDPLLLSGLAYARALLAGDGHGRLANGGHGRLAGDGHGRLAGDGHGRLAGDGDAERLFQAGLGPGMDTWPLLRARLSLAYGAWLRRHRRILESRPPLRQAHATFDALGAMPWGEWARQELRATGETAHRRGPQAWDRLTPQELQIAEMAATGASNREIGHRLYVSHRTVSTHLYRIFPKLGITSRSQLAAALAARSPER